MDPTMMIAERLIAYSRNWRTASANFGRTGKTVVGGRFGWRKRTWLPTVRI